MKAPATRWRRPSAFANGSVRGGRDPSIERLMVRITPTGGEEPDGAAEEGHLGANQAVWPVWVTGNACPRRVAFPCASARHRTMEWLTRNSRATPRRGWPACAVCTIARTSTLTRDFSAMPPTHLFHRFIIGVLLPRLWHSALIKANPALAWGYVRTTAGRLS